MAVRRVENGHDGQCSSRSARGEALLSIVYATDAKIEPNVKVVGVFPNNPHDPIVYPVAATVDAKLETTKYLAFLRSAEAKSIFEGYGFSVLAEPIVNQTSDRSFAH